MKSYKKVKQIFFSCYGDFGSSPEYFQKIALIADEIGCDLEAVGITIAQTKEKFGEAIVYCSFDESKIFYQILNYRKIYLKYFRQYPQYQHAIFNGADYSYLLITKKEFWEKLTERVHGNLAFLKLWQLILLYEIYPE